MIENILNTIIKQQLFGEHRLLSARGEERLTCVHLFVYPSTILDCSKGHTALLQIIKHEVESETNRTRYKDKQPRHVCPECTDLNKAK